MMIDNGAVDQNNDDNCTFALEKKKTKSYSEHLKEKVKVKKLSKKAMMLRSL